MRKELNISSPEKKQAKPNAATANGAAVFVATPSLGKRLLCTAMAFLLAFTLVPFTQIAFADEAPSDGAQTTMILDEPETGLDLESLPQHPLSQQRSAGVEGAILDQGIALQSIDQQHAYGSREYWEKKDPSWGGGITNWSNITSGVTLADGGIYYITGSNTVKNTSSSSNGIGHGIRVATSDDKAITATIRFVGTGYNVLRVTGGDGSGPYPAGAGIYIPSGSWLTIEGLGDVYATGGTGGSGAKGGTGDTGVLESWNNRFKAGIGGSGGAGAGAPGNAIGGVGGGGGAGGAGGSGTATEFHQTETGTAVLSGHMGDAGSGGKNGGSMGTLVFKGKVGLSATKGSSGGIGAAGAPGGYVSYKWSNTYTASGGGGGGGGGYSREAATIGSGGGGGAGGGGGGSGATYWDTTVRAIGGGGGGGGGSEGIGGVAASSYNSDQAALNGSNAILTIGGSGGRPGKMRSNPAGWGGSGSSCYTASGSGAGSFYSTQVASTPLVDNVGNGKEAARYAIYPIDECTITLKDPFQGTRDYRWTGSAIQPGVTITHVPTNREVPTSAYTVSYGTNTNAGVNAGSVSIRGKSPSSVKDSVSLSSSSGTGIGTETVYFNIKYDMDQYSIQWTGAKATSPQVVYAYTGSSVGSAALMLGARAVPTNAYDKTYDNNIEAADLAAVFEAVIPSSAQHLWMNPSKTKRQLFSIRKEPTIITRPGPYNDAVIGEAYALRIEAEGYNASPDTIRWTATNLPPGLSINASTGVVSGTPTTSGRYNATITARNIAGSDARTFTWVVGDFTGSVWNDRNHNGQKDPGEYPIQGITVQALQPNTTNILGSSTTDELGCYALQGFPATTVDIRFVTSDPAKYRVIGADTAKGIARGAKQVNKGFDIATQITLDAGNHGGFSGSPTKIVTGFQGDGLTIDSNAIGLQIDFGYRVEGWYFDQAFASRFDDIVPVDDCRLYAKYDDRIYTVNYSVGPEVDPVDPLTAVHWTDTGLLPDPEPYRAGYRLVDWVLASDSTRVVTNVDAYSDLAGDRYDLSVTLNALWEERHDIKVVLDSNGSLGAPASINGQESETHTDLTYGDYLNYSPPIREGYTFTGWSESKSYDPVTDPAPTMSLKVPGRDVTYFATWEGEDVGIIFDAAGGSFDEGEDGMRNGLPGEQFTLPDTPNRPGFDFKGWYETPAGANQVYAPGDQHGFTPNGKTYYFAQWEPAIVTVTLESAGTPETQSATGLSGSAVVYDFPTRDGHTFLGWDVDGSTIMFISYPAEDATYQAVWAVGNNTVAYNPMGGSFADGDNGIRQGDTGDTYVIPGDPSREGYVFSGWYKTPEYLEPAPVDGIVPPENATYYAKWDLADITAYLYSEGALHASPTGKYGSVIEYGIPEKANATFIGWKLQGAADATATAYPTYSAKNNQRYDAVFRDGEVSVIYNAAGGTFTSDDGIRVGASGSTYTIPAAPVKPGAAFDGWYDAPVGGMRVHQPDQAEALFPTSSNTVYFAQYKQAEIKVTLDAGSDATPPVQQYSGAYLSAVPYSEPIRDGYVFGGWKEPGTIDSTAVKSLTFPAEEKTYHAVWFSSAVEVRFEAMGGTFVTGGETRSGLPGTQYGIPQVESTGHLFLGWYDRPVGGTQLFPPSQERAVIPQADTSYYAHWAPIEVSATLDAGSGATPEKQAASGFFGTVIAYVLPAKAGHAFIGWKVEGADDSTATMTPLFSATDAQRYAAVWAAGQSSVSYDAQGGGFSGGETGIRTGATGTSYTPPADPTREGYAFSGWFTQPAGQGSPYTSTTFPAETNTTVYAYWSAKTYDVTLDLNYSGAPVPVQASGTIGQRIDYQMPFRDGFSFLGWSIMSNGSPKDANYFPVFTEGAGTLYAQWEADSLTVRFHPVAGAFTGSETGFRSGKATAAYSIPSTPIRAGHTFAGWFTDIAGGTQVIPDGILPAASTTYYAQWTADAIDVTLDLNYTGSQPPTVVTGTYNEKIDYDHPERIGFTFVGWSSDAGASAGDLHPFYPAEAGTTLYAVWEPRTITVTYDAMGGSFAEGNWSEHSGAPGDAYDIPIAYNEGKEFKGWFTTPLGQTSAPDDGLIPVGDAIYYAQWAESLIDVTLHLAGGTVNGSGAAITMNGRHGETIEWPMPDRAGYAFVGWKLATEPDSAATRFLAYPESSTSYTAVWSVLQDVKVIYDPYGGIVKGESVLNGKPGATYTAPGVEHREGYAFEGWALQPTDSYADHAEGDEMTYSEVDAQTIYYAKWAADTCTVTLEFEDGTHSPATVSGALGAIVDYADLLPARESYVFKGWGSAPDSGTYELFPRFSKDLDGTTLHAHWDPAGLMVTFFAQGAPDADRVIEGKAGESYTVVDDPVRDGYRFQGWFSDRNGGGVKLEKAAGDTVPFEAGMTVAWYASWERISSTVTLDADGGAIEGQVSVVMTGFVNDPISYSVPEREGYSFAGWSRDAGATVTFSPYYTAEAGVTYAAQWLANDATLTYHAMQGSFADGEDGIREGKVGDPITMPVDPTRPGYAFGGWYRDTAGLYPAPHTDTIPLSDERYYAKWVPVEVTVQLSAVGSNLEMQTLTGRYGEYISYQAPYREGQTFIGWKNRDTAVVELNPTYPATATVYEAAFTAGSVIATFDPAGGRYLNVSGTGADSGIRTGEAGEMRQAPARDSLARYGYAFKGWFTSPVGGTEIGADGTFALPTVSATYYAQWEKAQVRTTLDAQNGDPAKVMTGLHGEAIEYDIPAKDDNAFMGWALTPESEYGDATMFPVFDEVFDGATYYAQWSTELASVAFFAMEGEPDVAFTCAVGEKVVVPDDPKRDGHTFGGWYDAPIGGAKQSIAAGDEIEVEAVGNITYYARYIPRADLRITFDAGHGATPGSQVATGAYGSEARYSTPIKEGSTFRGWKLRTDPVQPDDAAQTTVRFLEADATYDAVWRLNDITYTFETNGGSPINDNVRGGSTDEAFTLPASPTRVGYDFAGWYTLNVGGTLVYPVGVTEGIFGVADATFYAHWNPLASSEAFDANGGAFEDGSTQKTFGGDFGTVVEYELPLQPTYAFVGWSTTPDGTSDDTSVTIIHSDQVNTYYAQWEKDRVSAIFRTQGGSFADPDETAVRVGVALQSYDAPEIAPRTGYRFGGWYTEPDGNGDKLPDQPAFTTSETTIYYAHWLGEDIEVTLHGNGGTVQPEGTETKVVTGKPGEAIGYVEVPKRPGYGFKGWSADSQAIVGSITPVFGTEDETLYAIWDAQAITIEFQPNGGAMASGSSALTVSGKAGDAYTVPTVERKGYAFKRWFTSPADDAVSPPVPGSPGASLTLPGRNQTYYAQWTPISHETVLDANGGSFVDAAPRKTVSGSQDALVVMLPGYEQPVSSGYSFQGWSTSSDGSSGVSAYATIDVDVSTFYAIWNVDTVTVTYHPAGGSGGGTVTQEAGSTFSAIPGSTPSRAGYTFTGWFSDPFDSSTPHPAPVDGLYTMPDEDMTWYAQWSAASIALELDANGGTFAGGVGKEDHVGAFGSNVEYTVPARAGYVFKGWNLDGTVTRSITFPARNASYKAEWDPVDQVSVTYDAQKGTVEAGQTAFTGLPGSTYAANAVATLSREGYSFGGWFSLPGGKGDPHPEADGKGGYAFPDAPKVWYAHWVVVPIGVTLDPTGGTIDGDDEPVARSGEIGTAIGYGIPQRAGYAFAGWAGTETATTGDMFPTYTTALQGTTLYALWLADGVSAVFFGNGGTFAADAEAIQVGKVGEAYTVPVDPVRTGHTFNGWYDDATLIQPAEIKAGDEIDYPSDAGIVAYWAKWTSDQVGITLKAQGGTIGGSAETVITGHYGEAAEYELPLREGYVFSGWSLDKDASSGALSLSFSDVDQMYYAIWSARTIAVAYDGMLGTVIGGDIHQGAPGTPYIVPKAERSGYTFRGWASTPHSFVIDGPKPDANVLVPAYDAVYFAQWEENLIKVTFNLNGGMIGGSMSNVEKTGYAGEQVIYTAPQKNRFVFMGWRVAGASDETAELHLSYPSQSTVYYAVWKHAGLNYANYHAMAGQTIGASSYDNSVTDRYTAPSSLAPDGFVFSGWSLSPESKEIDHRAGETMVIGPGASSNYYAVYVARPDITVTLDPAGGILDGSTAVKTMTNLAFGTEIHYNLPTRDGFHFVGWSIDGAKAKANMSLRVPPSDTTFYAVWLEGGFDELSYASYHGNGGIVMGDSLYSGHAGETYDAPGVEGRTGYDFLGWATTPASMVIDHAQGEKVSFIAQQRAVYYAIWQIRSDITVRLNVNGGTWDGVADDDRIVTNQRYADSIIAPIPSRDGHLFMGWSTAQDATYGNPNITVPAEDATYYAVWLDTQNPQQTAYAFYDAIGGTVDGPTTFEGIASSTYTAPHAHRTGYAFKGWSQSVDGPLDHDAAATVGLPDNGSAHYWALWEVRSDITITLDPAGGSLAGGTRLANQVYATTIAPETPVRTGYLFVGWKPVGTVAPASASIIVGAQDEAYIALWSAVPVDEQQAVVLYDGTGGTVSQAMPIEGLIGDDYTAPSASRPGFVFKGWSKTLSGSIDHDAGEAKEFPADAQTVYYALWQARGDIELTLYPGNGSAEHVHPGKEAGTLFFPETPQYDGHVFVGWRLVGSGDAQPSTGILVPDQNAEYEAVWQKQTAPADLRVALFDTQGGTLANGASPLAIGGAGTPFTLPDMEERSGHTFEGWEYAGAIYQPGTVLFHDAALQKAFIAQWRTKSVEVTLAAPGSDIEDQVLRGTYGEKAEYAVPYIPGETFMGWKAVGSDDSTAQRDLLFPQGDGAYVAVWKVSADTSVTYDLRGGLDTSDSDAPIVLSGKHGTPYAVPAGLYRAGYSFAGWFEMPEGQGTPHPDIDPAGRSSFPREDAIWYAAWDLVPITVFLDADGGSFESGTSMEMKGALDTAIDYPVPARAGYSFVGWASSSDAVSGDMTPAFERRFDGATLYALWKAGYSSVAFMADGGKGDIVLSGKTGGTYVVPANPSREGYRFAGWYDSREGGNKVGIKPGDVLEYTDAANTAFWARWNPNTVVVTLDGNQGSVIDPIHKGVFGETIAYAVPSREGHTFRGWSTDRSATAGSLSLTFPLTDATYYALWSADTVVVTFDAAGGSMQGQAEFSGTFGGAYSAPQDPTRSGYAFRGWSTKVFGSADQAVGTFPSRNIVYYAQWDSTSSVISPVGSSGGRVIGSTRPGSGGASGLSGSGTTGSGTTGRIPVERGSSGGDLEEGTRDYGEVSEDYTLMLQLEGGAVHLQNSEKNPREKQFLFVPAQGYRLHSIVIDGEEVEVDTLDITYADMRGEHTVDARFILDGLNPLAPFELAARYNPFLWLIPGALALAVGAGAVIAVRAGRKRPARQEAK